MNLRGGVITIGSLLWDDNNNRQRWRENKLVEDDKFQIYLPIRYGRCSCSRNNTYTMVFSSECCLKDKLGIGWIIPIKAEIDSFEVLEREARDMGAAEGFKNGSLFSNWGSVALFLNPKKELDSGIKEGWKGLFSDNNYVTCLMNTHIETEKPIIDPDGFLSINWPEEVDSKNNIDKLDLLIATVTKPTLTGDKYPTVQQIADAMNKVEDYQYFCNNIKHGISTFQDTQLLEIIGKRK